MDAYAESMLYDDVSTEEDINIPCPSCQHDVQFKMSDPVVKCKRCGESFYVEEMNTESQG